MVEGTPQPGELGLGASGSAPTAPHATPSRGGRRQLTGPERFWTAPSRTLVGVAALVGSVAIHYALSPWSLLPEHAFELRRADGVHQQDHSREPEVQDAGSRQPAPARRPAGDRALAMVEGKPEQDHPVQRQIGADHQAHPHGAR